MLSRGVPASSGRSLPFLTGGGPMAELITRHRWEQTALGPITLWPAHVRTVVAMMLRSEVPVVTLWGEGGVMLYNQAYSVFAGARHPSLLGSRVREGWPEVASFNDHVMRTVLAGRTLSYQDQELTLFRSGQPEQVWLNLNYSPLLDDAGRPCGVIAFVIDNTARVRAERRVQGEGERLRGMFNQAPAFMAMLTGPDHVFDHVNEAYLQLVGRRDILGKPVHQALPEVERQGFVELLDKVYASGEPYTGYKVPVDLQRPDADAAAVRYLDFIFQPVRDEAGKVVGIFVQGVDVTEREAAQDALRQSEAQLRAFAQAMPNHVWAARPDGLLYWFNQTVYDYSGAVVGDLDGTGWASLVHPEDLPGAGERWAAALSTGMGYENEFRLRRADGAYRWHLARAVPIREARGPITGWVGSNTDIHDQKAAA